MGTVCTIKLFSDSSPQIYDELFARLQEIDRRFSLTKADSDISRINRAAGKEAVRVHEDAFYVIQKAVKFAALTGGAFNPAIGAVSELWGFNSEEPTLPRQTEIDARLPLLDYKNIILNQEEKSVFLAKEGMSLDLGGIAKGYAADELARLLEKGHVQGAVIDLGGNILLYGKKTDGSLWRTGIKNPLDPNGEAIFILSLPACSVVTSGIYERCFEKDCISYHHILDPKTGHPADGDLLSLTVISSSSMEADALSTALFVMGKEKALDFAERSQTRILLIDKSGNIVQSGEKN